MSTPSSASASASATVVAPGARICFNSHCKEVTQDHSALRKKGWRLRNGETADLCDRCSCVFEQGTFCQKFHSDVAGWRNCETCGKRVHCGCIASASTYVFADAGGIECYACARNSLSMAPNQMLSSPMLVHQHALERKDMPSKTWRQAGPFSGQWRQASHIWNLSNVQSDLQQRLSYEFDRPLHIEKMTPGGRQSISAREKKIEELPERQMCTSLNNTAQDKYAHSNTGENDSTRKLVVSGPCSTSLGINFETKPNSSINLQPLPVSKDDASLLPGLASSFSSSNGVKESMKLSSNQPIRQGTSPLPKKYYPQGMTDEEMQNLSNGRARVDTHSRAQLLPRYWPRITDQELQQISGDSNSSITPLFEKMLSASDAGRIGRLVLPKKCAEAYFPIISQPEGLPLRVQDATGKDWVFQFRFWPNNNSRMYVLEGVTPCIQAMKLQAGDTVTFSRIDPEGKLVMGFRKASNSSFEQDPQTLKSGNNFSLAPECNDQNATDPILYASLRSSNCSIDLRDPVNATEQSNLPMSTKAGLTHNDGQQARSLQVSTKRKASSLGSKSKRLRIENEEAMELKLTWEEAQELLRPPPNSSPSVVVIEGHEFEEYEEAPVLGKRTYITTNQAGENYQWAQCEDCLKLRKLPMDAIIQFKWTCAENIWDPERSSCSVAQELSLEPTSDMLSCKTGASKSAKTKAETDNKIEAEGGGLNALANLAILGEGKIPPASRPTTKHPRHRPGCTCIVCIQPPSGKGPKHKQSCACNVCLTVKRRFTTLMLRREKRQSEKEAEVSKNQRSEALPQAVIDPPSSSPSDVSASQKVTTNADTAVDDPGRTSPSPLKTPKIDLNIQPEREEEPSPKPDTGGVTRLLQQATTGTLS